MGLSGRSVEFRHAHFRSTSPQSFFGSTRQLCLFKPFLTSQYSLDYEGQDAPPSRADVPTHTPCPRESCSRMQPKADRDHSPEPPQLLTLLTTSPPVNPRLPNHQTCLGIDWKIMPHAVFRRTVVVISPRTCDNSCELDPFCKKSTGSKRFSDIP